MPLPSRQVYVCLTRWVSLRWLLWSWMRNYFGEHGQLTCGYICEECIHASSVTYTCWWVQYHAGLLQRSVAEYNGGAWKRSHDNTPPLPALTFFLLFLPRGPLGRWGYDILMSYLWWRLWAFNNHLGLALWPVTWSAGTTALCGKKLHWPKLTTEINVIIQKSSL